MPIGISLTVLGLLNSAVAAYYYLRIIVVMYFKDPGESTADRQAPAAGIQAVLWGSAPATLVLAFSRRGRWISRDARRIL